MARGFSARTSCRLIGMSRSSFAYKRVSDKNAALAKRLRELAEEQPKLGCPMAWAQLRKEFAPLNIKRVRRLWRKEKLNLRPRKSNRIKGAKKPIETAAKPSQGWSMDFCHDSCMNGTKIKCFAIVDEMTRENIALEVATRIPAQHVVDVLREAFGAYGVPEFIRCDNGPEFGSWTLRLFLKKLGVKLVFIQPGSPWQNGFAERFIGTLRSECLSVEAFHNLADAQIKVALWRKFYNEERPHSSLAFATPSGWRGTENAQKSAGGVA